MCEFIFPYFTPCVGNYQCNLLVCARLLFTCIITNNHYPCGLYSIPFPWHSNLSAAFQEDITLQHKFVIRDKKINIMSSAPKAWDSEWVRTKSLPFSREESWRRDLHTSDTLLDLDWLQFLIIPSKTTRETKMP